LKWPRQVSTSQALVSKKGRAPIIQKHGSPGAGPPTPGHKKTTPTVHAPDLDGAVVGARDDKREGGVERRPVDAAVMALEDVLDNGVGGAKEIALCHPRPQEVGG
jgi:hypothetical protein